MKRYIAIIVLMLLLIALLLFNIKRLRENHGLLTKKLFWEKAFSDCHKLREMELQERIGE